MNILKTTPTTALLSVFLCAALGSTAGCDTENEPTPEENVGGSGKADDATPAEVDDADECIIVGEGGACTCTYEEYDQGCEAECESEDETCDKNTGQSMRHCAPSVSWAAVACGPRGFTFIHDAFASASWEALNSFVELITDEDCGNAVASAVRCMWNAGLSSYTTGIMWDYNTCVASIYGDPTGSCCTTDSMCGGSECFEGRCYY